MLIPVVNEKDKILGYKNHKEVQPSEIYRVSALWITNSKGEILLSQRSYSKRKDPGKWGPAVAGTIEKGETYKSNIVKEAEEEIGLTGVKFTRGHKQRIFGEYNLFDQWFLATVDWSIQKFKIQKEEVEAIRWFSPKEVLDIFEKNPAFFLSSAPQWMGLFIRQ